MVTRAISTSVPISVGDTRNLIALNRQEKEKLVLDLYFNQGKNYRQIAKEARISPREIKRILDKDADDVQEETPMSVWAKAYKLFEEGKSPLEVAVALNIRADNVREFYKEFWDLKQVHDFNKMYFETGGHLAPILKLNKMMNGAGYRVEAVVKLLRVANYDLPTLENEYERLKDQVNSLEAEKQTSVRIIDGYKTQIAGLGRRFDDYCLSCEEEGTRLNELQRKWVKLEALVRKFENNDSEYIKIRKVVEERAYAFLSSKRKLLELAALSVIESIRENPEKYRFLIRDNTSSADCTTPDFNPFYMYDPEWPQQQTQSKAYFTEDYVAMLAEDTNKLMVKLAKRLEDEILSDYTVGRTKDEDSFP